MGWNEGAAEATKYVDILADMLSMCCDDRQHIVLDVESQNARPTQCTMRANDPRPKNRDLNRIKRNATIKPESYSPRKWSAVNRTDEGGRIFGEQGPPFSKRIVAQAGPAEPLSPQSPVQPS